MKTIKISLPVFLLTLACCGAVGMGIAKYFMTGHPNMPAMADAGADHRKPLYWVAPMDDNYRRDGPGKSPMGMDLVPVYEKRASNKVAGAVTISPEVINNLGVRTAAVKTRTLQHKITTVGYVKYNEESLIHIHPRVSGWIEKLLVNAAGDPVEEGEALYSLYSPELVNAQEELVLALNRQNKRLIEAAENRLTALQLSKQFIAELKRSRTIKQTVDFYAPQSGVVDNLNVREGFFVQPGTMLFSIGALDEVWVEAEIFERQASWVQTNDPVTMTLDFIPGQIWQGKIDYIYPTLDSTTRTVRIRARFANSERVLKPNMFAQITVHTDSHNDVLAVPREALIKTGTQERVVLALGKGRFKSVEVKSGRSDQQWVEITEGLTDADRVVVSAQFLLDSESSKSSDFKRMHHHGQKGGGHAKGKHSDNDAKGQSENVMASANTVWVRGEIKSQMIELGKVAVSHEAIEEWDMAAMTMHFKVSEGVDISKLTRGQQIRMEVFIDEAGGFAISNAELLGEREAP